MREGTFRGPAALTAGLLAIATIGAWTALLAAAPMAETLWAFLPLWLVMMAAMMLPSAAPMVLLYRVSTTGASALAELRTILFVAGYLVVWTAVGAAAYALQVLLGAVLPHEARPFAVAAIVLAAGLYQFTPLKTTCLRACRSPADFLVQHWRGGSAGALRMGAAHGVYCLGCCWALMAVLVGAGGMGLAWVALVAAVVLAEKLLPRMTAVGRAVGFALVGLALAIVARPELVDVISGAM